MPVNQNLCFYVGGILGIVIMIIICFILYELETMRPLRWHPPHLVDNTDTLYLRDQH